MFYKKFIIKPIIKESYKKFNFIRIILSSIFHKETNKLRVFFGGSRSGNVGGPLVKIKRLKNYFQEYSFRFNIVYTTSGNCFLTKSAVKHLKKKNYPIILNQNGVFYPAWFNGNYHDRNLLNQYLYHQADYIFWQSKFCKNTSEKFLGKRIGSGEILYNAVDTKVFRPTSRKHKNFNFLITGSINKKNNYRISSVLYALVDVLKYEPKVYLIIAGDIADKIYFISESKRLGIINNVKFLDKFKQEDAPKIYQMADAYITMSFQDNCPSAVIEAMSCGLPILYSASGGIPELVDKYSGIGLKVASSWQSIQIPDCEAISKGMINILENKRFMSKASRKRAVEKFDIKYWYGRHEYIFNYYLEKLRNSSHNY